MSRTPHQSLTRRLAIAAGVLLLSPVAALGGIASGVAGLPAAASPSATAMSDIPPALLTLYRQAADRCTGLPWPVLAGLGKVESNHNRPAGQVSRAGAEGPMQFLASTWQQYGGDGNGDGAADPLDPADAIPAAADYLCAHDVERKLARAVASYLCGGSVSCLTGATAPGEYATRVLSWAQTYSDAAGPSGVVAVVAVQIALAQVGIPYQWGGESPATGFDCSGLVQYAYARAGITLPRTAQTQYDAGPLLAQGATPHPGDLLFFGVDPERVTHVGLALGDGRMVDAPHTGALVRVEPIAGIEHYLGASRPVRSVTS
jgi:cell wall-associated NlpC family hydrolase